MTYDNIVVRADFTGDSYLPPIMPISFQTKLNAPYYSIGRVAKITKPCEGRIEYQCRLMGDAYSDKYVTLILSVDGTDMKWSVEADWDVGTDNLPSDKKDKATSTGTISAADKEFARNIVVQTALLDVACLMGKLLLGNDKSAENGMIRFVLNASLVLAIPMTIIAIINSVRLAIVDNKNRKAVKAKK